MSVSIIPNNSILLLTIISGLFCTVWVVAVNEVSYSFKYSVDEPKLGIVTHHWEERNGGKVRGGYSLLEPNGKVRVVEYQVDGNKGFKAFVTFRRPPGQFVGHLKFPNQYQTPIRLAEPVGLITPDLLVAKKTYPNLP
ncbi:PREDICTED: uncharacterized protein LOC108564433 isoform X3 [Nicrophorus vespilloides]|uniref:Uncharacterized protein LOC108564433 isoform X3 n=1 Tax=Nicrophorus vespilloides TaxID=110193 RepID=A0ABM1MWM2_NICVS|nr:PREDICTED: uncharacterized protein LOC108564433 isoform X3 [Nicrophorus vespilloides]